MTEGSEIPAIPVPENIDPKEALITEIVDKVPDDQKRMMEYNLRHLPYHLKELGMEPEEISQTLDDIDFPTLLRPSFYTGSEPDIE